MMAVETDLRRLYPSILALARARLQHEHDAQDAAQEAMVRVLRSEVREDLPFDHWVFTIAANVIRDFVRKRKARRPLPVEEPVELDPVTALSKAEDVREILACLQKLEPAESAPLLLHLLHGWPQKEIADALEIPVEHLRVRLFRTIRKIRRALGVDR